MHLITHTTVCDEDGYQQFQRGHVVLEVYFTSVFIINPACHSTFVPAIWLRIPVGIESLSIYGISGSLPSTVVREGITTSKIVQFHIALYIELKHAVKGLSHCRLPKLSKRSLDT